VMSMTSVEAVMIRDNVRALLSSGIMKTGADQSTSS